MKRNTAQAGVPVPIIVFAMVVILVVIVMGALLFAPEREIAPETSTLSYAEPPEPQASPVADDSLSPIPAPSLEAAREPDIEPETEEPIAEAEVVEGPTGTVTGVVRDVKSGLPLPDVEIVTETGGFSATTNNAGQYILSDLPLTSHGVMVRYQRTRYRPTTPLPYKKVILNDQLTEQGNVDFVLETAGLVWGYVTNLQRDPVANAEVVLCTSDSFFTQAMQRFITQSRPVRARTDEEGYYELQGVPLNQEWRVYADSGTHAPQLADPFVLTPTNDSARLDIHMFGGSSVSGIVVDPDGKPIEGADVVCIPAYSQLLSSMSTPQGFRDVHTDADGVFFIPDLTAGEYQVIGRKKGYQIALSGIPIHPDGRTPIKNLRVELQPVDRGKHRIVGEVVTASGMPIAGAQVVIEGVSLEQIEPIQEEQLTDDRGRFAFNDLPASSYEMQVQAIGYAPRNVPRVLLDQETKVILSQSAVVRGQVLVMETNEPAPGAMVDALFMHSDVPMEGNQRITGSISDNLGNFTLSIPEGTWTLEARVEEMAPGRQEVSVVSGDVIEGVQLFVSRDGGVIAGRVVTQDGTTPQGARVALVDYIYASDPSQAVQSQTIYEDGLFEFKGLSQGIYNVIVEHDLMAGSSSGLLELAQGQRIDDIVLRLGSGGSLYGYVFANGQVQVDALLMAINTETMDRSTARTDENGFYEMMELSEGTYQVTVMTGGGNNPLDMLDHEGQSVTIFEGQSQQLNFGVCEGNPIQGSIYPSPRGMLGGEILLRAPGSPPIAPLGGSVDLLSVTQQSALYTSNIDISGRFQFDCIVPGAYQVEVYYAFGFGPTGDFRNVYTGQVVITGENDPLIQLNATL